MKLKKRTFVAILFLALLVPVGLSAQERSRRAILVGTTSVIPTSDDETLLNAVISSINANTEFQGIQAVQEGADASSGTIAAEDAADAAAGAITFPGMPSTSRLAPEFSVICSRSSRAERQTTFTIILLNLSSGSTVATEEAYYTTVDGETILKIKNIIERMLALIPAKTEVPNVTDVSWKTCWLYPYAQINGIARVYNAESGLLPQLSVQLCGGLDVQVLTFYGGLFGAGLGVEFSYVEDPISKGDKTVSLPIASATLFIKGNFYPKTFLLSLYGGAYYFTASDIAQTVSLPLGFIIGIDGGIKLGPGILAVSLRYSQDLGAITQQLSGGIVTHTKTSISAGLAYKLALAPRPKKTLFELPSDLEL
jgi:hypothetical protein